MRMFEWLLMEKQKQNDLSVSYRNPEIGSAGFATFAGVQQRKALALPKRT